MKRATQPRSSILACVCRTLVAVVACAAALGCASLDFLADFMTSGESHVVEVSSFVRVERDIPYSTSGDVILFLDLYLPSSAERVPQARPLIVHVHGGGWTMGARSCGEAARYIPALVRHGYVVASVDYRLAPKYRFPAQLEDIRRAVAFLVSDAQRFGIDPGRIGLIGTSAGAHLAALYALERENPTVRAVVDMFGPTDLRLLFRGEGNLVARSVFGAAREDAPVLVEASPACRITSKAPAFLAIHGERDVMVPLEQSELFVRKLRDAGAYAELLVIHGAGHALRVARSPIEPSREEISAAILEFFDRFLR